MQIIATNIATMETTISAIALSPKNELKSASILRSAELKNAKTPSATLMPNRQV